MLYYRNPKYDCLGVNNEYNIFKFRKDDWASFESNIKKFFETMVELAPELSIDSVSTRNIFFTSRKFVEDTLLDKEIKISITNSKKSTKYDFCFILPYMDSRYKFTINNVKRFLLMQMTDFSVIRRKLQIRLNNNLRQIVFYINKVSPLVIKDGGKPNIYTNFQGNDIPLCNVILARMPWDKIQELCKVKFTINEYKPEFETLADLLQVTYTPETNKYHKFMFEDLSKVMIDHSIITKQFNKSSEEYIKKYTSTISKIDIVDLLTEIFKLDIYFNKFIIHDSVEEDILRCLTKAPSHVIENDIRYKRIRIHEYIFSKLMEQIYTQVFKQRNNIKSISRNYSQDILPSKFQEMMQASKIEDNVVGDISELYKISISGVSGIPLDSITTHHRNINKSYFKYLDPIVTPDGKNCGVVEYLTITCPIDQDGKFIIDRK